MKYFNNESKNILKIATDTAKIEKRKFLTIQQFYLSSLRNPQIESLLSKMKVDVKKLKALLKEDINKSKDNQLEEMENEVNFSTILQKFLKDIHEYYTRKLTLVKNNNLNESHALIEPYDLILFLFTLQRSDQEEIKPIIFIQSSIFECSDNDDYKNFVVNINNICSNQLRAKLNLQEEYILEDKREIDSEEKNESEYIEEDPSGNKTHIKVTNFLENLNTLYKEGKIDTKVIGRTEEISNIIKVLSRKKKNNPIIVGESGVGKSSVIDKLVGNIVENKIPKTLKNTEVWSLNISKLISGTKYRGDFEKRMNLIIEELRKNPNNILFIDNIHQILHAGSGGQQGLDVASLLQPALSNGYFKCIGIDSLDNYNKVFLKDKTLPRRFQKIVIDEPSLEETKEIVNDIKFSYEEHHGVEYSEEIIDNIINLSDRYLHYRNFPDKAIDLLDETGALYSSKQKRGKQVKIQDVYEVVSQQANLKLVNEKEQIKKLKNIKNTLSKKVHGQEEAVNTLCQAVMTAKAGLNNPKKPFGSFLFLGPTGVGKTEITLQLAEEMGLKVHRFDMSEFMESHTVSKLIGAPPGYVGYEESGQLTDAVDKDPYSIVLLDEIEKANPNIFNTLLQVLDNGFLTNGQGKKISFRNTIIVMTSNAGAKDLEKKKMGFTSESSTNEAKIDKSVFKGLFSPEFRNRLSAVVTFNYLSEKVVLQIVDKFIGQLQTQLEEKNIKLELTSSAKKLLKEKGYDKNMGARPMERVINDHIKQPLSYEILFGELSEGGIVKIRTKDNKLIFEYI